MSENIEGATPADEEVIEQPKSMDDTIRETLRSLQEKGAVIEDETPATPEAPEEKAQRIRDEKGKFAKTDPVISEAVETPETPVKAAPNTWKKEVAEKWATLPPEVQSEVERREADFHKGIETYKQKAQFAETIERTIAPYVATIQALGVTPDVAIQGLLNADHRLRYGTPQEKSYYMAELAKSYGIDLGQIPQGEQPPIDPTISALQQQVQQLTGYIQNQASQVQQAEAQTLNSTIASFAADPKHSHFESVRGHMAALLQAGQAKDLEDAYEQAVYANPTTRAAMIAQQQAVAREEAAKKAQAAKTAASVNVRARPSMPVSQPIGSMDDTIRATLRRLQSA